jgi:flagellar motility protein MotE (MotC chaperone)
MSLDFNTLDFMRQNHPAWRLLNSPNAPLVASFLHRAFIDPNERIIAQADLVEKLEDVLFTLREQMGAESYPRSALEYLNDWAGNDKGWLRKFYRQGSDEPHFDLTPATEKVISWLSTLTERTFVGTESRLLTLFELLNQIDAGSETDPAVRIAELQKRRDEIDTEIARILEGDMPLLDDTALRDRFQQFLAISRELLSDFREVEHNFRMLDRDVRERIALWEGSKGDLLEEVLGERDAISDSDQGRSFRAFWDFLMSSARQDKFSRMLERVLTLPAVAELNPDSRIRHAHYDWLEAGEYTQRTVAQLSQQLRRFLDDQAWLENRRIMEILKGIESKALSLREVPPPGEIAEIAATGLDIELPMERPLYKPALKAQITDLILEAGEADLDATALFSQVIVNKAELSAHIRRTLQGVSQITLRELCERRPLQHGLAELVAYLELSSKDFSCTIDEAEQDSIVWWGTGRDGVKQQRQAHLPRVIFIR